MNNYTSRRSFLQTGAAAAAGAFTIVSPQSVRGTQANSKISVGLIGSGNRGSSDCKIFQDDPRAQVTALCDRFPDQFERAKKTIGLENPKTYTDFEKLLAAPDIDAVVIATPPYQHPANFEAAVQAGKHIYLEKPIGVDVEGCARALAASRKADPSKTIAVGFQARYSPAYLEAYQRIKNGDIGEIAVARGCHLVGDFYPKRRSFPNSEEERVRNWFTYRDLGGDFIVEQDCHNMDVLHWFLGGVPVSAIGRGGKKVRKDWDILDHISVIYTWPNGLLVSYEANQVTVGTINAGEEFTGTKGLIKMTREGMVHSKGFKPSDREELPVKREITIDAIENFLGRIVSGNPENAIERSALSTCVGLLGREAIYTGREVTWQSYVGPLI